jgi:gas vesicle protein GvpO
MAEVTRPALEDRHQPTKPTRRQHSAGAASGRREHRQTADAAYATPDSTRVRPSGQDRSGAAAASAARRAARLVAALSGRTAESVISIERTDGGWQVGVEVVEVSRIPDSADILAVYDVRLDERGGLISYRRVQRYARGHADRERRG